MPSHQKRLFRVRFITRTAARSRSFSSKHAAKVWIYQKGEWENKDIILLYHKNDLIHEANGEDVLIWRASGSDKIGDYPVDQKEEDRLNRQKRGLFGVESYDVNGDHPVSEFQTLQEAKTFIYEDEWGLSTRIQVRSPEGEIVYTVTGVDVQWWHTEGGAKATGRQFPEE